MSLDIDAIIERRRLRRRLTFWRTAAIVVLTLAVITLIETTFGGGLLPGRPYVARVSVVGVITENNDLIQEIVDVADDQQAKAMLVYIDSPGGTVVGGEAMYAAIRKVAEKKPVVAVMGTTAASAGYMIALGADTIFARQGTLTGSIGVLMQSIEITSLMERLGVTPVTVKSAPLKAVPSPLEPLTPEARQVTQEVIDAMYVMFTDLVRERRGIEGDALKQVSDGRIFTGKQALERRLVDAIGGEDTARLWLEKERGISQEMPTRAIEPPPEDGLLGPLGALLRVKGLLPERLTLDGLIALWHPDLRS